MPASSSASLAILALAATGCTNPRPETLVICHNANCAEPTDPEADDTLAALDESLALTFDGRTVLDGVEIDSFWKGDEDICLFAHDLDNAERVPATDAAAAVAAYIARPGPLTFSGAPFRVFIELKGTVDASGRRKHSPAQRDLHAECAWAIPGIPLPLDGQTHSLDEYDAAGIDLVEMHPGWLLDGQFQAAKSADLDMVFWMFDATVEILAAIDRFEPAMVETSEARLMRGWLEY
jgi:hypothetical protein